MAVLNFENLLKTLNSNNAKLRSKPVEITSAQYNRKLHESSGESERIMTICSGVFANPDIPEFMKAVISLQMEHGLRISEVLNIEKNDISQRGYILIKSLKGSKNRLVSPSFYRQFWFNSPPLTFPLSRLYSRFYFYRWYNKLGLYATYGNNSTASVTHIFRHELGLHLKNKFNQLEVSKSFLGHVNAKSTEAYEQERK